MRRTFLAALALTIGAATACASPSTDDSTAASSAAPSSAATTAPSTTPAVTVAPPTQPSRTPQPTREPSAVVEAYYDAINAHDYRTAWNLGGKQFSRTYDSFVAAFAGTAHDRLRVRSVSGSAVAISLEATQTSGAIKLYSGVYYVSGGVITGARVRQVGESQPGNVTPSPAPTVFVHPGAFCSPEGATGWTVNGTPMMCTSTADDDRARWRQVP